MSAPDVLAAAEATTEPVAAPPKPLGRRLARALFATYLGLVGLFLALPVLLVVVVSFDSAGYVQFPPEGLSLQWYERVLESSSMRQALLNSTIVGVASTLLAVLLGVPASLVIARRRFWGRGAIYAVVLSPFTIPWVVFGLGLLYLGSVTGVTRGLVGMTLGHAVIGLPYVVRTCVGVLEGNSPSFELAARTLGANRWQALFLVTLPLMRAGVVAGAIFCLLISFINVPVAVFMTTASTVTIPVAIFSYMLSSYDPGVAAISTLQLLVILAVVLIGQRIANLRDVL